MAKFVHGEMVENKTGVYEDGDPAAVAHADQVTAQIKDIVEGDDPFLVIHFQPVFNDVSIDVTTTVTGKIKASREETHAMLQSAIFGLRSQMEALGMDTDDV